jgi:hypothetical protein
MLEYAWLETIDQTRTISRYRVNGGEWVEALVTCSATGAAVIDAGPDDDVEFEYVSDE